MTDRNLTQEEREEAVRRQFAGVIDNPETIAGLSVYYPDAGTWDCTISHYFRHLTPTQKFVEWYGFNGRYDGT